MLLTDQKPLSKQQLPVPFQELLWYSKQQLLLKKLSCRLLAVCLRILNITKTIYLLLEKNSDIRQVDSNLTKAEMHFFDKSCKKFGIKYNAVVDKSDPKEPTYYIFFKGKDTAVIEKAMKETYEMFIKEQAKPRLSVRAKLAFFRDRVTARGQAQQDRGKEKPHSRSEQQR